MKRFAILVFLLFSPIFLHAQSVEIPCPSGTSAAPFGTTRNPASGGTKQFFCIDQFGNMISNIGFIAKNGVDATSGFGLNANTKWIPDATFTNGQNTVSCANNDCNFTAADGGKICFGTNLTTDTSILSPTVTFPQGSVLFISSQQVACVGGTWSGTTGSTNVFVWGSDDTSALANAWNAAVSACLPLYLPSGSMLVQSGEFNTPSTNDACVLDRGSGYGSYGVIGTGFATSRIIPTPNFSPASCTGSTDGDSCFFSAPGLTVMNLTIWGAGQANLGGGFNGKVGAKSTGTGTVSTASNAYWSGVGLLAWGATTSGFTGLKVKGESNGLFVGVHNDGFGAIGCDLNPGLATVRTINLYNVFCAVDVGPSLQLSGPGDVYSFGGVYGWTTSVTVPAINITGGTSFYSYGDSVPFQTGGGGGQSQLGSASGNGGTVYLYGTTLSNTTNPGFGLGEQNGMVAYVQDSFLQGAGIGNAVFVCATCKFVSKGGNTIQGGTTAIQMNSGGQIFFSGLDASYSGNFSGVAPTCSATGIGSTGTCNILTNQKNEYGFAAITANGTGISSSGTITFTFSGSLSGPGGQCPYSSVMLNNFASAWNARATIFGGTSCTASGVSFVWDNNSVPLTSGASYNINYLFTPR